MPVVDLMFLSPTQQNFLNCSIKDIKLLLMDYSFVVIFYLQLVPLIIKNDPKNVHVHEFNIKPVEINAWLNKHNLQSQEQIGIHAPFGQKAIWELITQRKIISELNFEYTSNLALGYLGKARSGA